VSAHSGTTLDFSFMRTPRLVSPCSRPTLAGANSATLCVMSGTSQGKCDQYCSLPHMNSPLFSALSGACLYVCRRALSQIPLIFHTPIGVWFLGVRGPGPCCLRMAGMWRLVADRRLRLGVFGVGQAKKNPACAGLSGVGCWVFRACTRVGCGLPRCLCSGGTPTA
jgi:hypothetical protein